jgi:multidrug transporter EmrE-like cation transporter
MLMYVLLLGSVLCDVVGQVSFKLGLSRESAPTGHGVAGFLRRISGSPWIGVGVAVYAIAPLSLAFGFAALSYCGVVLASRVFLSEPVGARQWLATCTIAAGVALVCLPLGH